MNYELNISDEPMDCNCVVVNDPIPASEAEMEVEIAAIKIQHHRATIECRLAEAQLDRDCGFSSPTAMTSHHAKAGDYQIDPTTAIIGTLAIDKVIYLHNIDTCKEETQLYVPKISTYKGESYLKLQKFT